MAQGSIVSRPQLLWQGQKKRRMLSASIPLYVSEITESTPFFFIFFLAQGGDRSPCRARGQRTRSPSDSWIMRVRTAGPGRLRRPSLGRTASAP